MPNWVRNIMSIEGDEESLCDCLEKIRRGGDNDDDLLGTIDFEKIIPMPESEKANWYDWSVENWGTKWNASRDQKVEYGAGEGANYKCTTTFDTAWATPFPVMEELSKQNPGVIVDVMFADEGIPENCGNYMLHQGAYCVYDCYPEHEDRQKMFYEKCWNMLPRYYEEDSDVTLEELETLRTPVFSNSDVLTKELKTNNPPVLWKNVLVLAGICALYFGGKHVYKKYIKPWWKKRKEKQNA